jgi:hypothetical protein
MYDSVAKQTSLNTIRLVEEESDKFETDDEDHESKGAKDFRSTLDFDSLQGINDDVRTIIVKRFQDREIRFNNLGLGDIFYESFADSLVRDHNIQKMMLSNNRLTSRGAMAMMNKVSYSTNYLDLSSNADIKIDAYKFLAKYILQDYRKKINHLDLEGNNIGDDGVDIICNTLAGDGSIKYLNVCRNAITDKGAKSLSEMIFYNRSITALFLSWNEIKGEGARLLARGLQENNQIKVFDMSFNPIGSMHFQKTSCIKSLSDAFSANKTLMHVDFSYCGFSNDDLENLNFGLKYNHSILGIHMIGNQGGIDSLGFLAGNMDPPSSSQLISKIDKNLKAGAVDKKDLDLQK